MAPRAAPPNQSEKDLVLLGDSRRVWPSLNTSLFPFASKVEAVRRGAVWDAGGSGWSCVCCNAIRLPARAAGNRAQYNFRNFDRHRLKKNAELPEGCTWKAKVRTHS
jgi:hypothetical protein